MENCIYGLITDVIWETIFCFFQEVAILRLFVRSQKIRIDTLNKQNESYRKTLHKNTFEKELEKIDRMFQVGLEDEMPSKGESPNLLSQFLFG
jgi:hypothetical protein